MNNVVRSKVNDFKWCIIDENNQYVHKDSIKKVNRNEYTYTYYSRMERSYPNKEMANIALSILNLHNVVGKLGHDFKIIKV